MGIAKKRLKANLAAADIKVAVNLGPKMGPETSPCN